MPDAHRWLRKVQMQGETQNAILSVYPGALQKQVSNKEITLSQIKELNIPPIKHPEDFEQPGHPPLVARWPVAGAWRRAVRGAF